MGKSVSYKRAESGQTDRPGCLGRIAAVVQNSAAIRPVNVSKQQLLNGLSDMLATLGGQANDPPTLPSEPRPLQQLKEEREKGSLTSSPGERKSSSHDHHLHRLSCPVSSSMVERSRLCVCLAGLVPAGLPACSRFVPCNTAGLCC